VTICLENPEDMFRKSNIFCVDAIGRTLWYHFSQSCKMLMVIKWNESLSGLGNSGLAAETSFWAGSHEQAFFSYFP